MINDAKKAKYVMECNGTLSGKFEIESKYSSSVGYSLLEAPQNGMVSMNKYNGVWVYTPTRGFTGTVYFSLGAKDGDCVLETMEVEVEVEKLQLRLCLTQDKDHVDLKETIVYTLEVINSGTLEARNIRLHSTSVLEQIGTTIVAGVVTTESMSSGILIERLLPAEKILISYSYRTPEHILEDNPEMSEVVARVDYECSDGTKRICGFKSNPSTIWINHGELEISEYMTWADRQITQSLEQVTYHINFMNKGNVPLLDVELRAIAPIGTMLLPETLLLESVPSSVNQEGYLVIGEIAPETTVKVHFEVRVEEDEQTIIETKPEVEYRYQVDPQSEDKYIVKKILPPYTIPKVKGMLELVEWFQYTRIEKADEVIYHVSVCNTGDVPLENIEIETALDGGGVWQGEGGAGLRIGELQVGEEKVFVRGVRSLWGEGNITTQSEVGYRYGVEDRLYHKTLKGEPQYLLVCTPSLQLEYQGAVDKAQMGDLLHNTLVLHNNGSIDFHYLLIQIEQEDGIILKEVKMSSGKQIEVNAGEIHLSGIACRERVVLEIMSQVIHLEGSDFITQPIHIEGFYRLDEGREERSIQYDIGTSPTHILKPALEVYQEVEPKKVYPGEVIQCRYHVENKGNVILRNLRLMPSQIEGLMNLGIDSRGGEITALERGEHRMLVHRMRMPRESTKEAYISRAALQYYYELADGSLVLQEADAGEQILQLGKQQQTSILIDTKIQLLSAHALRHWIGSVESLTYEVEGAYITIQGVLRLSIVFDPRHFRGEEHTEVKEILFKSRAALAQVSQTGLVLKGQVASVELQNLTPESCFVKGKITIQILY